MTSPIPAVDATTLAFDQLPAEHPLNAAGTAQSRLIRSYQGERTETLPVWFMRQAGRSLPEYRAAREGYGMLESCLTPELAAEITLQPVRRHGVDAAIYFSDIMVPLKLAGVDVEISSGVGPVLGKPVRTAADIAALGELDDAALEPIREAVKLVVKELGSTPLIGFAGAPFTLAAYMVEGRPSRDHLAARSLMYSDPEAWRTLCEWTARVSGQFLRAQVEAGASAGQLFDSWAGSLGAHVYREHVQPASAQTLAAVKELGVPLVHFGTGTSELLVDMKEAGADVVGVDYRLPLDEATRRLGSDTVLQGNIDPALLSAGFEALETHTRDVIERGRGAKAHVVNLGHGVPPTTDPEILTRLVELIHSVKLGSA